MVWVLFVGDSRARLAFAALLHLLPLETPSDWPHHDLGGVCAAHWRNGTREGFGYYDPKCQTMWKGGCYDDRRGRNVRKSVCALDATHMGHRFTFLWHSINSPLHLEHLQRRLDYLMRGASGTPTTVFASNGMWDMVVGKSTCARIDAFADLLRPLTPDVRIMGFRECPRCADAACLNWPSNLAPYAPAMDACVARALRDVKHINVSGATLRRDVVCGNMHLFGRGSEALVADLVPTRSAASVSVDFDEIAQHWTERRFGVYRYIRGAAGRGDDEAESSRGRHAATRSRTDAANSALVGSPRKTRRALAS